MGLVKEFFSDLFARGDQKIKLMGDKLSSKNTTQDGRVAAFEFLKEIKTEEARYQMLRRFDYVNDKTILDAEEKESIAEVMRQDSELAVPALKRYLKDAQNISGPLAILEKLIDPEEYLRFLLSLLVFADLTFNKQGREKNERVLHHLKNYPRADVADELWPLLADVDDDFVLQYFEILDLISEKEDAFHQKIGPRVLDLIQGREFSQRVWLRFLELSAKKRWIFNPGQFDWIKERLPASFKLSDKGLLISAAIKS